MGKFDGFDKVKLVKPQRSTFDKSHNVRVTASMGTLTPVLCEECVPSDTFTGSSEMLVRLAPLLAPIYDQIEIYCHFFFVPNRLLWYDWEKFITGGRLGPGSTDPVTAPVPPFVDIADVLAATPNMFATNTLSDYLGVPILPVSGDTGPDYTDIFLDIMPYVAYTLIWSEYYRDRNFVADIAVGSIGEIPVFSGEYTPTDANPYMITRQRCFGHDYFTSALPFTQRGADVLIPLDGSVTYLQQSIVKRADTGVTLTNNDLIGVTQDTPDFPPGSLAFTGTPNDDGLAARIENIDSISNANTTINDFRSAYALQVWLERNAIGGSRYTESVQAHFGVRPQDSRLNRPEYIGGGRIPVKISEVVSTAYAVNDADASVPQANMAGHGITYGNTNQFKYFCTEHGFIMGILSIMPVASYHQGMPRMFYKRRTFLDYPWPTFAKLGEMQVDQMEVYADAATMTADEDGVLPLWGYQSQYADWKYSCNRNAGDFHDTLLFWTLTRNFTSAPTLGDSFNTVPTDLSSRIFAVAGQTFPYWLYVHNRLFVKRPLPYFGTPNTLGFV